jgi:hypothetical protein
MHSGFNTGDRQRLRKALARVRRARPFRRLQALLWLAEGRSISEVARLARRQPRERLQLVWGLPAGWPGPQTLGPLRGKTPFGPAASDWPWGRASAPERLGPKPPGAAHYQSPGWTLALLATHLQKCCGGQRPSPSALRGRLHALGWGWKRPRYVFGQPDPQRAKKNARA